MKMKKRSSTRDWELINFQIHQKNTNMEFIDKELDDYCIDHTQKEPELLKALSKETWQKILIPRMLSGHFQGRLLSLISKILAPKSILEIGTYTGYSTLCLAEGLAKDGKIHTIDINEELVDIQQKYFQKSEYREQIISHIGAARDIIPAIKSNFDLIFIDADKSNYSLYLDLVLPKLNPKAVVLSDNVLWSGKVIDKKADDDDTIALRAYNKKIKEHPDFETILLPVRDGLSISRFKD
jgi:predicted O-methyltransferase YrrM